MKLDMIIPMNEKSLIELITNCISILYKYTYLYDVFDTAFVIKQSKVAFHVFILMIHVQV